MHMPAAATGCNCSTWQLVHQQQPQQRKSQPRLLPDVELNSVLGDP
jgi:hypothetical protein